MSMDEKNVVFLSAFTDGSNDPNHMERNMTSSKKISEGSSCEDDADSSMRPLHTQSLQQSNVEPIEPTLLILQDNGLDEAVGENIVGDNIQFEAELDEGDTASDVEAERLHRVHEEPIAYLQLRRIGTDGRSMKRRRIDN
ncbi:hypothetical protein VPH35_092861 [Triticum aestivum]